LSDIEGVINILQSIQSVVIVSRRSLCNAVFFSDFTLPIGVGIVTVIVTLRLVAAEIIRNIGYSIGVVVNIISIRVVLVTDFMLKRVCFC
jgi:hypothetical protein